MTAYPAGQRIFIAAPDYALERAQNGKITFNGAQSRAAMEAAALATIRSGEPWRCPLPVLAEAVSPTEVAVLFEAEGALRLDLNAPWPVDSGFGFSFSGDDPPLIQDVRCAGDDPRTLYVTVDRLPEEQNSLFYAVGQPGGVRDAWAAQSPDGLELCRWALPAALKVC